MPETLKDIRQRFLALDSSAVSDAMDSMLLDGPRVVPGLHPQVANSKLVGPIFTVTYTSEFSEAGTFANAGTYIDDVPPGHVVVIDSQGRSDCTNWGDLLSRVALHKGLGGTVVYGAARDIADIRALGYPLWSSALNAVSGKNRTRMVSTGALVKVGVLTMRLGDWLFGDDNALLLLPQAHVEEILARAERVSLTEDRIASAVEAGMSLKAARERFNYSRPWQVKDAEQV
ncbi:MAG TPA: hypothetical protein VHL08_08445 [Dongiaceae bacterium]|nr:hypothetical protein [Dongiaceae bacterium]